MEITDIQEVRRDGKTLPYPFDAVAFSKLGWQPDKIIEVRWRWGSEAVSIRGEHGIYAHFVFGHHYVAALLQQAADPNQKCELVVYNGDGTLRLTLPREARTPRGLERVEWVSFESMAANVDDHFGAIADVGDGQWAYVVNAVTGDLTFRGESR